MLGDLFDSKAMRNLMLALNIVIVVFYAWFVSMMAEPNPILPSSVIKKSSIKTKQGEQSLFVAYHTEAGRVLSEKIAQNVSTVSSFLSTIGPFKNPPVLVVTELEPDFYQVTDSRIVLGSNLASQPGELQHALLKVWLLQNAREEIYRSVLRLETSADLLFALMQGEFQLSDLGWPYQPAFFESIASLPRVCRSGWMPLDLRQICKSNDSHLPSELSLRPFIGGLTFKAYENLGFFSRLKFVRLFSESLKDRKLAEASIDLQPLTLSAWRTRALNELALLTGPVAQQMADFNIEVLRLEKKADLISPKGQLATEIQSSTVDFVFYSERINETPMLHKLSSRNAPEARRWRLAQENLDEAYVHRTLSPDFLSKSSDSGFWSKRQRFRPKVYTTLGESPNRGWASLLESGKSWPNHLSGLVEVQGEFLLLPGEIRVEADELTKLTAHQELWESCQVPALSDFLKIPIKAKRILYVHNCDVEKSVNYVSYLRWGTQIFAIANPGIPFVQLHQPSLELALKSPIDPTHTLIKELVTKAEVERPHWLLGLNDSRYDKALRAHRALGAVEAIEWYRSSADIKP